MKILNAFLTASLLISNIAGFANSDGIASKKGATLPSAPGVWENSEIEIPQSLKFLKAKYAHVPVADFLWGNPSEVPVHLNMVPVAPFEIGNAMENAPKELDFIKARYAR